MDRELFAKVERMQDILVNHATGGQADDEEYKQLRSELLAEPRVASKLPAYVRTSRDTFQFWQFIKYEFRSYAERREFLWSGFRPILEDLERGATPLESHASQLLQQLSTEAVHDVWSRALARRNDDPAGAITTARTLLETTCKHILDEREIGYDDGIELPKLYKLTAEALNLAPSQHSEAVFKQILGGCTAVVEGLGALRNRLGDAHGSGQRGARPTARHAQLAVDLSGAMATFLVATWQYRKSQDAG